MERHPWTIFNKKKNGGKGKKGKMGWKKVHKKKKGNGKGGAAIWRRVRGGVQWHGVVRQRVEECTVVRMVGKGLWGVSG